MEEYQNAKLPFVKREYGVVNPQTGKVIETESRDYAVHLHGQMEDSILVHRQVSEWLACKSVEGDG